jgi:hypothetical protein
MAATHRHTQKSSWASDQGQEIPELTSIPEFLLLRICFRVIRVRGPDFRDRL